MANGPLPEDFDWRRVEVDLDNIASLYDRFPPGTRGRTEWRALLEGAWAANNPWRPFERFLDAVDDLPPAPIPPRLFVSHQSSNVDFGERIAELACDEGFFYWLDAHDAPLAAVNALPPTHPRKSVLIAALIEIGLLNSTHVIAVHTTESAASQWVPYELGRAKVRLPVSTQAAGWFNPRHLLKPPEYTLLAVRTSGERPGANPFPPIGDWLAREKARLGVSLPPRPWGGGQTTRLP